MSRHHAQTARPQTHCHWIYISASPKAYALHKMENMFKVEPRQWSINTDWAEAWSPQFFPQQSFTVDSASFTPQTLPTSYPAPVIPSSGVTSKRQRPMEASQAQKKVKPSPKNQHSPGTTKDGSRTSLCTASPVQQPDHGHNFMPGSTSAAPSPTLPRYTPPLMQHSTDQHTTHNHGSARPSISPIATVVPQLAINTNKTQSQARHKRNSSDGTTNRDNPTWKAAHNLVERNYRDRLNDQIQELSNLLFDNTSASNNKGNPFCL